MLIPYCVIVHYQLTQKYVNYLNVNCDKMLKMFIFQQTYAQCLYSIHIP